jgi:putative acetyltransferase
VLQSRAIVALRAFAMPRLPAMSPESSEPARTPIIELLTPATAQRLGATRELFLEYAASLGIDLCFQNFDAELAGLPGDYAPPQGALLLALVNGEVAGCGALRALPGVDHANACEMKRVYVRPRYRGIGLGRMLVQVLLERAAQAGYSSVLLDTLDDMDAARTLYVSLGFQEVAPYYVNPIAGVHFLKADLA